jgi:multiple sugar transport system substrate-binding protein
LLLTHTDDTFITPVFNGSANLRNAAGQLIEEVVKAINRKKTVDDAFLDALYKEMNALYKLNSQTRDSASKRDFGILPTESVILITGVGVLWIGIGGYVIFKKIGTKTKKMKK